MSDFKSLAELREDRGLSQAEVARKLNISQQGYGLIEKGDRGLNAPKIQMLAEILRVDTNTIISLALNNNNTLLCQTGTDS